MSAGGGSATADGSAGGGSATADDRPVGTRAASAAGMPHCTRSLLRRVPPRTAVIVGAGIVGLSTAWFLQQAGVEVTVLERDEVAAGSSWGNAGWVSPGLSAPLPEPSILRYAARSLIDPRAPLYVPARLDLGLARFLLSFAAHCTSSRWRAAMRAYVAINARAFEAYDELAQAGAFTETLSAPLIAAFTDASQARATQAELAALAAFGQQIEVEPLHGEQARAAAPALSDEITFGLRLGGQRYIAPTQLADALAQALSARGGSVRSGTFVREVRRDGSGLAVSTHAGEPVHSDVVVLASGAWLGALARPFGVRTPLQAGRGYSFVVAVERPPPAPIYLPAQRIACTPVPGGLRLAGMMELTSPDAPLAPERVDAMIASARPLLNGVAWESIRDIWVGPRPLTADGLPLIGATRDPGVYVAGGHGMWGVTLGPVTGLLLARQIVSGVVPEELRVFEPTR